MKQMYLKQKEHIKKYRKKHISTAKNKNYKRAARSALLYYLGIIDHGTFLYNMCKKCFPIYPYYIISIIKKIKVVI